MYGSFPFFLARISSLSKLKQTADAKIKPLDSGAIIESTLSGIVFEISLTTNLKALESFNKGVISL